MRKFVTRFLVAVFLVVSLFQIPIQDLYAENRNFGLIYFDSIEEVTEYANSGFIIDELYTEYFLSELNEEQVKVLENSGVFYELLGDITTISCQKYLLQSNDKKRIQFPPEFYSELQDIDKSMPCIQLIQFIGPVKKQWRETMSKYHVELYSQLNNYAYLTYMTDADAKNLRDISFIRAIDFFPPSLKIQLSLQNIKDDETNDVSILATDKLVIEDFCKKYGIDRDEIHASHVGDILSMVLFEQTKTQIDLFSLNSNVFQISEFVHPSLLNAEAAQVVGIRGLMDENLLTRDLPPGLEGEGEIVGVADTGLSTGDPLTINPAFCDPTFSDKVIAAFPLNDWGDFHSHGTHVAGTICGTGVGYSGGSLRYKGMAPKSKLVIQNWGSYWDHYNWTTCIDLFDEAYQFGVRIHNNSTGEDNFYGEYSEFSNTADWWTWNQKDMSIVKAAGNERSYNDPFKVSLGNRSASKNLIVVGATENDKNDPQHPCNPTTIASFSSRGPCHDGRIKPDVVAPGDWLVSAKITNGYTNEDPNYYNWRGTSMAAPVVTGSLALIREYYRKIEGLPTDEIFSSLLKATLINGCVTEGFEDHANYSSYPEYSQALTIPNPLCGWGRVNVKNSLYPEAGTWDYYQNIEGLNPNEEVTYFIEVVDGDTPLKMTLVWNDYPGEVKPWYSNDKDLVNNLDLSLFRYSDDAEYRGNQFYSYRHHTFYENQPFVSIANYNSLDNRNNVELINIPNPLPGVYKIKVKASAFNPFNQTYSLVSSGNFIDSTEPDIAPPEPPLNVKATTFCDYNLIEWDEAESNYYPIDYYAVLRVDPNTNDPELLNILDPSILQHQDTTCQYDKNYSYFVVAVDDHGNVSRMSNIVTAGEALPPVKPQLYGDGDAKKVALHWTESLEGTCPVNHYRIFKSQDIHSPGVEVAETDANTRTWTDYEITPGETYYYYVKAYDSHEKESAPSNLLMIITPKGYLDVRIFAETNRKTITQGDTLLLKVETVNNGNIDCKNHKIEILLPQEISYERSDRFRGIVGRNNTVAFDIGLLEAGQKISFNVTCVADGNIYKDTRCKIVLNAYCSSEFQSQKELSVTVTRKKNSQQELQASMRFLNAENDPSTGKNYIVQNTPLKMLINIKGGTHPYTLDIQWGDGSSNTQKSKVNANTDIHLEHLFEAKGNVEIKVTITDSLGRTKNYSFSIEVR
jgi:fibronectin type 3 domain-containing protein